MPRDVDWTLDFVRTAQHVKTLPGDGSMVVIGRDDQNPICIKTSNRSVVCVEEGKLERFMNRSVFTLADFLCAYQMYRIQVRDAKIGANCTVNIALVRSRLSWLVPIPILLGMDKI